MFFDQCRSLVHILKGGVKVYQWDSMKPSTENISIFNARQIQKNAHVLQSSWLWRHMKSVPGLFAKSVAKWGRVYILKVEIGVCWTLKGLCSPSDLMHHKMFNMITLRHQILDYIIQTSLVFIKSVSDHRKYDQNTWLNYILRMSFSLRGFGFYCLNWMCNMQGLWHLWNGLMIFFCIGLWNIER